MTYTQRDVLYKPKPPDKQVPVEGMNQILDAIYEEEPLGFERLKYLNLEHNVMNFYQNNRITDSADIKSVSDVLFHQCYFISIVHIIKSHLMGY